jgi:hypothetical protein
VDLCVFDIGAIAEGDFYVSFTLRCKSDGFKFVLYTIYGPAAGARYNTTPGTAAYT